MKTCKNKPVIIGLTDRYFYYTCHCHGYVWAMDRKTDEILAVHDALFLDVMEKESE